MKKEDSSLLLAIFDDKSIQRALQALVEAEGISHWVSVPLSNSCVLDPKE
jgi:hypothetical protein